MMIAPQEAIWSGVQMLKLYIHEVLRQFKDRLLATDLPEFDEVL